MKTELARSFELGGKAEFDLKLINVSENETYRIDCADGRRFALRVKRLICVRSTCASTIDH